jgi:hypothetical protein
MDAEDPVAVFLFECQATRAQEHESSREQLGFAFAQGVIAMPRGWFAQNATALAARFDLSEQNEQNRCLKDWK